MVGRFMGRSITMNNKLVQRSQNNQPVKSLDDKWALMNAAMERLGLVRKDQQAPAPHGPAAGEVVELSCVCAVHDKPYTLRFTRQASGLLRFFESVKVEPARHKTALGGAAAALSFSLAEFDENSGALAGRGRGTPCAWCGDGSFHHCASYCGALVCGGRMKGERFHCRPSCGASWVGVPLQTVEGTRQQQARKPTAPRRQLQGCMLLLGAGGDGGQR